MNACDWTLYVSELGEPGVAIGGESSDLDDDIPF